MDAIREIRARLETLDTGKPIQETRVADWPSGADALEYFAGLAPTVTGETIPLVVRLTTASGESARLNARVVVDASAGAATSFWELQRLCGEKAINTQIEHAEVPVTSAEDCERLKLTPFPQVPATVAQNGSSSPTLTPRHPPAGRHAGRAGRAPCG